MARAEGLSHERVEVSSLAVQSISQEFQFELMEKYRVGPKRLLR